MRWACWGRDGPPDHRHMLGAKGVARADAEASRRHAAAIHAIAETVRVVCPWAANRARFACRRSLQPCAIHTRPSGIHNIVGWARRENWGVLLPPLQQLRVADQLDELRASSPRTLVRLIEHVCPLTCFRACSMQRTTCSGHASLAADNMQNARYDVQQTACRIQHAAYGIRIMLFHTTDPMQTCNI